MRRGGRIAGGRIAAAGALALALSACAPTFRNHGYVPPPDALAALALGVDTPETVAAAVGRPGLTGVVREDAWFYVQERVRHSGWRAPEPVERQLLALSFAPDGRLANVERFGLRDGRVVVLSRRVTDSAVRDFGLVQQILRNVGRLDVGEQLAADN